MDFMCRENYRDYFIFSLCAKGKLRCSSPNSCLLKSLLSTSLDCCHIKAAWIKPLFSLKEKIEQSALRSPEGLEASADALERRFI